MANGIPTELLNPVKTVEPREFGKECGLKEE